MPRNPVSCLLSVLALGIASGWAQEARPPIPLRLQQQLQEQATPRLQQVRAQLLDHRASLGLDSDHDLVLVASHVDTVGQIHGRFDQTYRGLKVWGASLTVHRDLDGSPLPDTNRLMVGVHLETQPTLGREEALAVAQRHMGARGAFEVEPRTELVVLPDTRDHLQRIWTKEPELPNAAEVTRVVTGYRLAYKISLRVDNAVDGLRDQEYLVDAHSGSILRTWSRLKGADTPVKATGRSQYSGTVNLDVTQTAPGQYLLKDLTRGVLSNPGTRQVGNMVLDMGKGTELAAATNYTHTSTTWGDGLAFGGGDTKSANGQTAAVDAAFGMQSTWDFFKRRFGRNGIDGKGTSLAAYVHHGSNVANALWDYNCWCTLLGDGKAGSSTSWTTLDVMGHEYSHGITDSLGIFDYYDEAGGLNEANSDILGKMVEFYTRGAEGKGSVIPDTGASWTFGSQLGTSPVRYFIRPSRDGYSFDSWVPGLGSYGVYLTAGPMNRAFYFLSVGASSDPGHEAYSRFLPQGMTGIKNDKAAGLWWDALNSGMIAQTSNYLDVRQAMLESARKLYGLGSVEMRAVADAFAAVNVGLEASKITDYTRPTVTASVSGSTGPISLIATTPDTDVQRVEFWVDLVPYAILSSPPWSLTVDSSLLSNATSPAHSLHARAVDRSGNLGVSPMTLFTVNNPVSEGLQNGGFESGAWYWRHDLGNQASPGQEPYPYVDPTVAHSGEACFVFGKFFFLDGKPFVQRLFQSIQIPSTANALNLTFWLSIQPKKTTTSPVDTLKVQLWDQNQNLLENLATFSNVDKGSWTRFEIPLETTKYAGRRVHVAFVNSQSNAEVTHFFLDDVALSLGDRNYYKADPAVGDVLDMSLLARWFGRTRTSPDWSQARTADLNRDGVVDDIDVQIFLREF